MNKVLAIVGDKEIKQSDIESLLRTVPKNQYEKFSSKQGQKELLEELIAHELFYLDAKDTELDKTEEYKNQLKIATEKFLKSYAITNYISTAKVTEEEAMNFYEKNKNQFNKPIQIRASHILLDSEEDSNNIMNKINNGMSFEDAALKYSKCPSKDNNGDLGYFTKGKMVKEFEDAAFEMEIGEIRSNVKTQFGFHIIKIIDKKEEGITEFEEAFPQIKQYLLAEKQNNMYLNKVNNLKKKYTVSYK